MGRIGRGRTAVAGALIIASLMGLPAAVSGSAVLPAAPKPRPTPKPDARIAVGLAGSLVGDGVFNATGAGQAVTGSAKPGRKVTFTISIQNDGDGAAHPLVQAAGASAGYRVKYLSGTTDVTAAVVAGTFTTGTLAPGASEVLIAKVTVKAGAAAGSSITRLVTITIPGPTPLVDAVKLTAKRK